MPSGPPSARLISIAEMLVSFFQLHIAMLFRVVRKPPRREDLLADPAVHLPADGELLDAQLAQAVPAVDNPRDDLVVVELAVSVRAVHRFVLGSQL